ncbi:hypothetical protein SOJ16_002704 [Caldicellulosiruptor danielii]|uniref:Uncharacterized protein n=1 Tax=Anaerocellum danielii TaxID=1387557 RepID=A0ABZ0TZY7_9FIRM|nr:hypothetical protein [Caldicellulosiruptor danielii]WPX08794.1 hypothetical protein SOJ16_002704 [Caldicellulosiruptor danielii]
MNLVLQSLKGRIQTDIAQILTLVSGISFNPQREGYKQERSFCDVKANTLFSIPKGQATNYLNHTIFILHPFLFQSPKGRLQTPSKF